MMNNYGKMFRGMFGVAAIGSAKRMAEKMGGMAAKAGAGAKAGYSAGKRASILKGASKKRKV